VRIFRQQAKSGPKVLRAVAEDIAEKLAAGESFADAPRRPPRPLSRRCSSNSSRSASKPASSKRRSTNSNRYYETSLHTQRKFRSMMAYPAIQFLAAIFIISGLIFILGFLGGEGKSKMSVSG